MISRKQIAMFFAVLLSTFLQLAFAETAVIVHPSNTTSLGENDINKIFLGKTKSFPGGGTAVPINQKEGQAIRTTFDETILGKSSSQVKSYWSKLLFTGKGTPPKEVSDDAEVKKLVASDLGGIGYIDAANVDDSVKTVFSY